MVNKKINPSIFPFILIPMIYFGMIKIPKTLSINNNRIKEVEKIKYRLINNKRFQGTLNPKENIENKKYWHTINNSKISPKTMIYNTLNFTNGLVKNGIKGEGPNITYEYKIKMLSSMSGKDLLTTNIESSNATDSSLNLDLQGIKGTDFQITSLYYKFPIYENLMITLGPKLYGYEGLAGKSTAYNERIAILDGTNFTTNSGNSAALSMSYINTYGLNYTLKVSALNANEGIFKSENEKSVISQIGFTSELFGGTITYNERDSFEAIGISIYIIPENVPSFNISLEYKETEEENTVKNWLFAIGNNGIFGEWGAGIGTYDDNENIAYESWYIYKITDKVSITPILFLRKEGNYNNQKDELGLAVNASFRY
tara:strand:- start:284 stop:1396 length:1113 start_codon:yes stop_codon:yes gene_type:complete